LGVSEHSANGAVERREVLVLANPKAGPHGGRQHVLALLHALRERGLHSALCAGREELSALVRERADALRCVVAAGGDGTLNEVLNRAPGVPVAILPLGNENLVARYFRLSRSAERLADAIAGGRVRRLDLARAHGRLFSLMAGVGFDARVVHDVHQSRRGHINKLTYALPLLRALASYPFPAVEVSVEETGERLEGAMAFLFNLPVYGLGLPIAPQARADDGLLDLVVFERPGRMALLRYLVALLGGGVGRLSDIKRRRVKCVRLASSLPVPLQTDGDPAGGLPTTIEVVPGALPLLAPEAE
jgi:diacylglycerol kinase family enzyme